MTTREQSQRSERLAEHVAGQLRAALPDRYSVEIHFRDTVFDVPTDLRSVRRPRPETCCPSEEMPRNVRSQVSLPHRMSASSLYVVVSRPTVEHPVLIVQIVSPVDKSPGEGGRLYRAIRDDILRSPTDLVEIDFSEGSLPLPLVRYTEERRAGREVIISAADRRPQAVLWSVGKRDEELVVEMPVGRCDEPVPVEVNGF